MTASSAPKVLTAVFVGLLFIASACGEPEPELTIEDRLADVYGRTLSETEVADKLATASMLCQLGEPVLDGVWRQLNERQLNYQDVVFGHICPERAIFYASLTGRYVTEEAVESGVVPSTTRPPLTTTTETEVTTTIAEIEETPTGSDNTGTEDTGTEDPDAEDTGTEDSGTEDTGTEDTDADEIDLDGEDPTTETTEAPQATIAPAPTETTVIGEGG